MRKIQIKREYFGVKYNNDCPFCGVNTNLLEETERVVVGSKKYCKNCYQNGINNKKVTPGDFYDIFFINNHKEKHALMENNRRESICNKLAGLEIAYLYGEYDKKDSIYLDLYYVMQEDTIYFRLSIADDDGVWFAEETYNYISPEQAIGLLNKNGIHILDGLTLDNWKNYFDFID